MKNIKQYFPYIIDIIIYIIIGVGLVRNWIAINLVLLILLPKITFDEFREWKENRKISTFISFLALFVALILQVVYKDRKTTINILVINCGAYH